MSDVGTGIFAKGRVVPEDVVALSAFPVAFFAGCSCIHFHRVLSGKEVWLGQRMLCQVIETTVVC